MQEALLSVQNLKTYFRTPEGLARAVDGISFDIAPNEIFALVGESGCGKSVTALSVIQLVAQPAGFIAGGAIYYNGQDITRLPEVEKRKIQGNDIAMVFQEPMTSLNPVFTIGYQISEAIRQHQDLRGTAARNAAIEMLDLVGIPEPAARYDEYPHQMSGGMKQRVMIAMALSCRPGLLIADEPTTALDVTIQAQILELIQRLQQELQMAVLLITHDLGVVGNIADRVAVMYAGKIAEIGTWEQLYETPQHPYTVKLLESTPARDKRGTQLHTIAGRVPKATDYNDGCRFAGRCPKVMDGCDTIPPTLHTVNGSEHNVACHLYNPEPPFSAVTTGATKLELEMDTDKIEESSTQSADTQPQLQVKNLCVHYPIQKGIFKRTVGYVYAVDDVTLDIPRGKTLALVGESGSGKTSFGKGILRLGVPVKGDLIYDGDNIATVTRQHLHPYRKQMQIIFQDPYASLNPRMTVGAIIQEGMQAHDVGESTEARQNRVAELMQRVGLSPDMVTRYPHEFSGGQRQRIGIARCLAVDPEFIVCDEATSALDVSVQAQILNLLKSLQTDFNLTYLFITHNLSVVEYFADEVAVMYLGRIVERGTTEEIFDSPKHPYTRALLSAVPKMDPQTGVEKIQLEGDVPSPINRPSGCYFHPRCPEVMPMCKDTYPDETRFTQTHSCNCYLY
ncbi:ABC transporter ATP-binding protein [Candidatus Poribacteria bacterium]|nr:ABC transporter ATP-binding protein [Candidatus Poribacteria bacterium]MYG08480.1 ABC transporter ATP-binding protein [Candidatus Poribacteria bacterium]MYK22068.1 ABC transporter ATP-binding protein [Candidatus Poribacteria bacterium]